MKVLSKETITKWEYEVRSLSISLSVGGLTKEILNDLGQEGWELVSVSGTTVYLKRNLGTYRKEI